MTYKTHTTEIALKRAQAFNDSITRHVVSLIATTKAHGAPNGPTLIKACEEMLRVAWEAGEMAAPLRRLS